jgi:hypothetical protein
LSSTAAGPAACHRLLQATPEALDRGAVPGPPESGAIEAGALCRGQEAIEHAGLPEPAQGVEEAPPGGALQDPVLDPAGGAAEHTVGPPFRALPAANHRLRGDTPSGHGSPAAPATRARGRFSRQSGTVSVRWIPLAASAGTTRPARPRRSPEHLRGVGAWQRSNSRRGAARLDTGVVTRGLGVGAPSLRRVRHGPCGERDAQSWIEVGAGGRRGRPPRTAGKERPTC